MTADPPPLGDLVHAICEGRSVDWDALERDASPSFRQKIAALRMVETIARVHRSTADAAPDERRDAPAGEVPERWGQLQVLEHVASGAFGDVYRAWDPGLDREVALKLLRRSPDADAHADEAVDEGRLLARVRHPNIVAVHGAARIDGRVGLWMEFVRGRTLAEVVERDGPLSPARAAAVAVALCEALAVVHAAGLVHRDVKARNVMLADDGRVVLMDFGAGGDVRHAGFDRAGTPLYLAPEVAAGAPATPQSDVYAVGVLLQYLVTGRHATLPAPGPRDRTARRVLAVAKRATTADPQARYQSADACARALRHVVALRSVPRAAMVAGGGLLVLLAIALGGVWQDRKETGQAARPVAHDPPRLALRPLWHRRSPDLIGGFARPSLDGRVYAGQSHDGALVVTDLALDHPQPPIEVGAASDGLAACTPHVPGVLTPSGSDMAFLCELPGGTYELRTLRTDVRRPVQRRVAVGPFEPLEWSQPGHVLVQRVEHGTVSLGVVAVDTGAFRSLAPLDRRIDLAAVSPDGRWVLFDGPDVADPVRRDVFVVRAAGGEPERIVTGSGDDVLPSWSADGRHLLYVSDRTGTAGLWALPFADGRAMGAPLLLSPDLGRVVDVWPTRRPGAFQYFRQVGLVRVATMPLDGEGNPAGAPSDVPTRHYGGTMMSTWSPDGRRLAYHTALAGQRASALGVLDLPTGDERMMLPGLAGFINPRWSPDGRHILVKGTDLDGRDGLFIFDVERKTTRLLKVQGPRGEDWLYGGRWRSDGDVVTRMEHGFVRLRVGTGDEQVLAAITGVTDDWVLSPRDNAIAFALVRGDRRTLNVHGPDGRTRELLALSPTEHFAGIEWLPGGQALFVLRVDRSAPDGHARWPSLWRVDARTGEARALGVQLEGLRSISVSPDGRQLAFTTGWPTREPWVIEYQLPDESNSNSSAARAP
jgi:serine/threonine protein kinase/Tol biopolymer transport system component